MIFRPAYADIPYLKAIAENTATVPMSVVGADCKILSLQSIDNVAVGKPTTDEKPWSWDESLSSENRTEVLSSPMATGFDDSKVDVEANHKRARGSNSTQFTILPCRRRKRKAAGVDGDGDDDGNERLTIPPNSLKNLELDNLLPCPLRDARPAEYNGIRGIAFGGCHCGFKFISELE
jgi:hypothetical protein